MVDQTRNLEHVPPPQPYEPHPILRWLYRRFFAHIHVDQHWSEVVRQSSQRGLVVYVMRSLSWLDFLCLDFLLKRYGLPLVHFVNDLGLWILEPFGKGDRRLLLRRQIPEDVALAKTLEDQASALLFLRQPPKFARRIKRGEQMNQDLFRVLVEAQRQTARPILLVPQTFVWTKLPPHRKRSVFDVFFGPSEWPGRVRVFFQFLLNYRNVLLRSGQPFELQTFVQQNPNLSDEQIAEKVKYALLSRLERERALVLGPTKKSPVRIREEILRSPRVRRHMQSAARGKGKKLSAVHNEANQDLRRMIAAPDQTVLSILHRLCERLWNRIYDGIVVDKVGIERIRDAARHGTLVLLPSHKSHIDYVVLHDVLYSHALVPPLVAAGDNLSFWPIGPVLRRAGAFFIRRSFRGKKLYSALVDGYIRKMIVEGFNIEFFIEGGRSRTGKLLMPKFGLLSMVVDAIVTLRSKKVFFVPIYIGYERIIQMEERAYEHEVRGGEKRKENIGELLKTTRVLRSRYGRLYVEFGEVLDFDEVASQYKLRRGKATTSGEEPREFTPSMRRAYVQYLAHRVAYEINQVTVVTPASLLAAALLVHESSESSEQELLRSCNTLLDVLASMGARISEPLRSSDADVRQAAIRQALHLFTDGRLIQQSGTGAEAIYMVPEERRVALEYYKNNIIHFFVPRALIAVTVGAAKEEHVGKPELQEKVLFLSRLFKHEFIFRSGIGFEGAFDEVLSHMLANHELEEVDGKIVAGERSERLGLYRAMLLSFLESYKLAIRGSQFLLRGDLSRKEWLRKTLTLGQRMYLSGEITRREAISRPNLENALQAARDLGLVQIVGEQSLVAGAKLQTFDDVMLAEKQIADLF